MLSVTWSYHTASVTTLSHHYSFLLTFSLVIWDRVIFCFLIYSLVFMHLYSSLFHMGVGPILPSLHMMMGWLSNLHLTFVYGKCPLLWCTNVFLETVDGLQSVHCTVFQIVPQNCKSWDPISFPLRAVLHLTTAPNRPLYLACLVIRPCHTCKLRHGMFALSPQSEHH